MYNKTYVIAIDGIDLLGKSTISKLLSKKLSNAIYQKIPNRDGITYDTVYDMLKTGAAVELPMYFQCLNGINRLLWQKQNLPLLASMYKWIILDRWTLSSYVYGGCSGISKKDCDLMMSGMLEPDLYFLFDGEPFNINKEKDSYEKDVSFQKQVRKLYLEYAKEKQNVIVINANNPIETVLDEVYNHCTRLCHE